MIRLKSLLAEITLSNVQPYATQFTWRKDFNYFEAQVSCDGEPILFAFEKMRSAVEIGDAEVEYVFTIAARREDGINGNQGWSIRHDASSTRGKIDYLRLMRTAAEAILDFIRIYAPDGIDITGSDPNAKKDLQKTRIYRNLIHSNSAELAAVGYTILDQMGKLFIVRKSNYDTTGIEDIE
jgi:hypothetical protein